MNGLYPDAAAFQSPGELALAKDILREAIAPKRGDSRTNELLPGKSITGSDPPDLQS